MFKGVSTWFPAYIAGLLSKSTHRHPQHILFAMADHFEPEQRPGDSPDLQMERVTSWIAGYESRYAGHGDSEGRPPQHTYFFPQEQYRPSILDALAEHCAGGFGEVEVHIHHDADSEKS